MTNVVDKLSIDDFKQLFARNFPYLPLYNAEKVYFVGDVVYSEPNFYTSLIDNNTNDLSDEESWKATNETVDEYVQDSDISRAWREAKAVFNPALIGNCEAASTAFLYLVAFYLAYDLQLASSGAYGQISFPARDVRVGSVSEGYYVPQVFMEDPILGFYARNGFGQKYLSLVYMYTIGNVGVVPGWSLP